MIKQRIEAFQRNNSEALHDYIASKRAEDTAWWTIFCVRVILTQEGKSLEAFWLKFILFGFRTPIRANSRSSAEESCRWLSIDRDMPIHIVNEQIAPESIFGAGGSGAAWGWFRYQLRRGQACGIILPHRSSTLDPLVIWCCLDI